MNRAEINAFGEALKAQLLDGDSAVLTMIGAKAASPDCDVPSVAAVVRGRVGKEDQAFTGNALNLDDAITIARGKLRDARESQRKATTLPVDAAVKGVK